MKLNNKITQGIKFLTIGFLLDITIVSFLTFYVTQIHKNDSNIKSGLTEVFTTSEILFASTQSKYLK